MLANFLNGFIEAAFLPSLSGECFTYIIFAVFYFIFWVHINVYVEGRSIGAAKKRELSTRRKIFHTSFLAKRIVNEKKFSTGRASSLTSKIHKLRRKQYLHENCYGFKIRCYYKESKFSFHPILPFSTSCSLCRFYLFFLFSVTIHSIRYNIVGRIIYWVYGVDSTSSFSDRTKFMYSFSNKLIICEYTLYSTPINAIDHPNFWRHDKNERTNTRSFVFLFATCSFVRSCPLPPARFPPKYSTRTSAFKFELELILHIRNALAIW